MSQLVAVRLGGRLQRPNGSLGWTNGGSAPATGAGLIDATVVKVDAANDLALLKAVGRFAPLPIAASRTVKLGGTVATVGFPDIGLQELLTANHANHAKS